MVHQESGAAPRLHAKCCREVVREGSDGRIPEDRDAVVEAKDESEGTSERYRLGHHQETHRETPLWPSDPSGTLE
jgi:hypothetical protein